MWYCDYHYVHSFTRQQCVSYVWGNSKSEIREEVVIWIFQYCEKHKLHFLYKTQRLIIAAIMQMIKVMKISIILGQSLSLSLSHTVKDKKIRWIWNIHTSLHRALSVMCLCFRNFPQASFLYINNNMLLICFNQASISQRVYNVTIKCV